MHFLLMLIGRLLYVGVILLFLLSGKGWVGIAAITLVYYWLPNINKLQNKGHYEFAGEISDINPLYRRGFIRKKASGSRFWADYKGLFGCQIASLVFAIIFWGYVGYRHLTSSYYSFSNLLIEMILSICFVMLLVIWIGFRIYYCWRYRQDFRYVENENGIWMPFSYIFQTPNWGFYRPFHCIYKVEFDEMRERLIMASQEERYNTSVLYTINNSGEMRFFIKTSEKTLGIFILIHIEKLLQEHWDEFNMVFETFWKDTVQNKYNTDSVNLIFLLCVDEDSEELRRIRSIQSVNQKKGRYRLPVIVSYSEGGALDITANYNELHGKKKYQTMRKELIGMLGLTESYNNKVYPRKQDE